MDQLLKFVNNLNTAQRAVIIGGVSLLFIVLVGFLVYSNIKAEDKKLNYTIASNLTKSQVMLASEELEAAGIQFSVIGTGNNLTLKTSKEFVNIAKIKLVTSEAATSKHVGWEIFEKSSLGTTNFENKVKYLRALEGELSRSLEALNGVLKASVKIAIPKDTIFTEKKGLTTASAILSIKPGIFLTQKQIDGIKNFIASAVPDLKQENIQLIDQDGSLLELSNEDENNQKSITQTKYKDTLEEDYSKKIVALLEPFVGVGRVVAKVTLSLDFIKKDIEEEIYNPEGTIRSQQVIENNSSAQGMPNNSGGVAGVDNNIQEPANANGGSNIASNTEGTNTVTNYEISRKFVSQKDYNYTNIKRITAAVTFDSSVLKDIPNKDEFIASLESIVQNTIGYDQARGDQVTVKDFKFIGVKPLEQVEQVIDENGNVVVKDSESVDTLSQIKAFLQEFGDYIQYLIAAILLFIFYKKFIASNEIVVLGDGVTNSKGKGSKKQSGNDDGLIDDMLSNLEQEFEISSAQGRLKSKVKSQILNNIDGLDEESAAKYEVFIEELDKEINNNPAEVARMIELLLTEGNNNFRKR
ncbi:flagellar basal-body MS-ring/collar protein FliF [Aliarcobacter cibarius]|uniref:Flagellar M-ring protein n=1 Tax=Aliarcobacter cibarius TaxID=255507 RepID=A0A7L5JN60_9BACT|nr:flagellar basal-body MS-ring/collar protein FliF [Aliarcobacter cibarius]QKJ26580.1 flagellar inner membrane MS-ring protein FliF [Aliarcobacter cibarius]TLS98935.1 flagellar M-ring protein FliF [Aliarcobacter cibarius]TLS99851.1 flagellar M-ring protein FliF [Aliarcobacter cibarius]TLT03758.1 flagellar M-ring protein FliF [Aliarcobacter cibarius]